MLCQNLNEFQELYYAIHSLVNVLLLLLLLLLHPGKPDNRVLDIASNRREKKRSRDNRAIINPVLFHMNKCLGDLLDRLVS